MTLLSFIHAAKKKLEENGVTPKYVKMSPLTHEWLVNELNKRDGSRHRRVFEVLGMRVDIENECPPGAAYISGE